MRRTPSDEVFDGSALPPIWDRLDATEKAMDEADSWFKRSQVLSDRRLDGAHRAGRRAYIIANALIAKARESQLMLAQTMTTPGVNVFPHATPDLIRPSFEAAATALWILDGEATEDRRLRGLRCAWKDHNESRKWADELMLPIFMTDEQITAHRAHHATIGKRYSDDARDLGLNWGRVTNAMNVRDEVGKFSNVASEPKLAAFLRAIWRRLSGVQHGLMYASLLGSDMHQAVPIPGGVEVVLFTNDDSLMTDCQASALMQLWAMSKYIERTRRLTR